MIYEDYFKSVIGGNFKSPEYYNTTYENKTYEPIQVNGTIDDNLKVDEIMDLYPDIYKVVLPMIDKMLLGKNISNLNDNILNTWTLEIYDSLEAEDNIKQQPNNNQVYESETTSVKPVNKVGNITDNRMQNVSQIANSNQSTKLNQPTNLVQTTNLNRGSNMIQTSAWNSTNSSNLNNNLAKNDKINNDLNNSSIESNAEILKENKTIDVVSRYQNRKNPILRDLIKIMILNRLFGNNNNRPPYPRPNYPGQNNPRPPYENPRPPYPRANNLVDSNAEPLFQEQNSQMPNYRPVDANPYSKYLKNAPKTYFDVPYPEEG